jgi:hypothetical protein
MSFLDKADKLAIARAFLALQRERTRRTDLERISMLDWLLQKRQTPKAIAPALPCASPAGALAPRQEGGRGRHHRNHPRAAGIKERSRLYGLT